MYQKTRITALIAILALLTIPFVWADSESVSATAGINPYAPSFEYVEITDTELSISSHLDVDREYYLHVHSIDKNGITDIASLVCTLFFAGDGSLSAGATDTRSCYTLTYTYANGTANWTSAPAGHLVEGDCSATPDGYRSRFIFAFSLGKIAIPSGDTNTWKVSVTIMDRSGQTTTYADLPFDVNDYIEWSGVPSTLELSSTCMDPESPWTLPQSQPVQAVVTSNVPVSVLFCGADLMYGADAIACETFTLETVATPAGGTVNTAYAIPGAIPTESVTLVDTAYGTACMLDPSLAGYCNSSAGIASFVIDAATGATVPYVPAGTYSAVWTFTLERGAGVTP